MWTPSLTDTNHRSLLVGVSLPIVTTSLALQQPPFCRFLLLFLDVQPMTPCVATRDDVDEEVDDRLRLTPLLAEITPVGVMP